MDQFDDWDQYFMSMVYLVAMKSKDPRTKIGAVIVGDDNEVISTGFNGLPRGVMDGGKNEDTGDVFLVYPERHQRPEKYFWYEHAERNAIYNAARVGVPLKSSTMYTQGIPCADCARGVIQAGIKIVIIHKGWEDAGSYRDSKKWAESAERSKQMFSEARVMLEYYSGDFLHELHGYSDGAQLFNLRIRK